MNFRAYRKISKVPTDFSKVNFYSWLLIIFDRIKVAFWILFAFGLVIGGIFLVIYIYMLFGGYVGTISIFIIMPILGGISLTIMERKV